MTDNNKNILSRDDLFLLMKSYENSVTLNTTLLEYQKQLLEKQNEILDRQKELCGAIDKILLDIKTHIQNSVSLNSNMEGLKRDYLNLKSTASLEHVNLSKEHTGINMRTYLGYAAFGTIIISLITVIYKIVDKIDLIDLIAKKVGAM